MGKTLISVIILYRSVQQLDECLADLAQQTIINQLDVIPLLLSDKESTEREKSFANRAEAINFGITDSIGEYLIVIDQEDRFRSDALEVFSVQLQKSPETSVIFANVLTSAMRLKSFDPTAVQNGFRWGAATLDRMEQFNCVGPHPCWRKSLHDELGFLNIEHPNLALWEFWLKTIATKKFLYLDDVLSFTLHPPARKIDGISEKLAEIDIRNAHFANKIPVPSDNPLVSVIIATRNRLNLLKLAVKSLIDQTWQNWEAIIINDGGEAIDLITDEFSDDRIRIINNPLSIERSGSRNIGIEEAKGQFVCFLDDDDVLYRHHFELGIKLMSRHGEQYQVLYFGANGSAASIVNGEVKINQLRVAYNESFDRERFLTVNYIPLQALIYRSAVFASGERFDKDMNCMEDLDLLIRLSQQHTFAHIPLITSEIRYLKRLKADDLTFHISSLKKLYDRYAELTNGCWDIQWKQEQWLRGLKLDISRMESRLPTVSVLLPPAKDAQGLMLLVDEVINQTRFGNYELILTATSEGHNLQKFTADLPVISQFVQLSAEASVQDCYNTAAAKAKGDYLVVFAPGVAPATGHWLGELVDTVQSGKADIVSSVVIDRKEGFLINELCYSLTCEDGNESLGKLYANHSLFSPWLRQAQEIDIPSASAILLPKEDFLQADGFRGSSSFTMSLVDLICKLRLANSKHLFVNPFSVLYTTEIPAIEALSASAHEQLSQMWSKDYCRTSSDFYLQDDLWSFDASINRNKPNYAKYETIIVEQARKLKERGKIFEAMLMMEPLLKIFPESSVIFDTLKAYLSDYNSGKVNS